MRFTPIQYLLANNATTNFAAIQANQVYAISAIAIFSDATTGGSFKLQASNDAPSANNLPGAFTPTNWIDIPNSSQTVASGASAIIPATTLCYQWVRLVWTRTGGAGTLSIFANSQSI